jgi:hypothetical protein
LKPPLYKQNPDGARVEELVVKITLFYSVIFFSPRGRLKPRLYKQNPPTRVEERLRYFLQSAEADFVFVGAVSTAVFYLG